VTAFRHLLILSKAPLSAFLKDSRCLPSTAHPKRIKMALSTTPSRQTAATNAKSVMIPRAAVPRAEGRIRRTCIAAPVPKAMIEQEPSFGYRTVAWLLGFNKSTVQRIFQLKGWQVRKRAIGMRPRIQAVPSVATAPNERWSTDLARVWTGKDGGASLALVIDCHTRELLGWHLSHSGKATTASAALEHALIARFGTLGRVEREFLLRSDNGVRHGPRTSGGTMAHSSQADTSRPWFAAMV
jgi:putative transposase